MAKINTGFKILSYQTRESSIDFGQLEADIPTTQTSVIIGVNGSGKSRLLAALAEELSHICELITFKKTPSRYRKAGLDMEMWAKIAYKINGSVVTIERDGSKLTLTQNGNTCSASDIFLPSRIFAVAHLPVDRFRFVKNSGNTVYRYLGLRQSTNLTTTGALEAKVMFSLLSGFERHGYPKQIEKWFNLLDLSGRPTIQMRSLDVELLNATSLSIFSARANELYSKRLSNSSQSQKFDDQNSEELEACWTLFKWLKHFLPGVSDDNADVTFEITAELIADHKTPSNLAEIIAIAKGLRILPDVELRFIKNSRPVRFSNLSSGEQQVLGTICRLLSDIEPNSLVLIDEPEVSLHPTWQINYIPTLLAALKDFPNTHLIIATHSHFMVSDVAPECAGLIIASGLSKPQFELAEMNVYGRSPENILYRVFGIASVGNFYVERDLTQSLQMISGAIEMNKVDLGQMLGRLKRVRSDDNPAFSTIIDEVELFLAN